MTTGSAFGAGPAAGTLPGQQPVSGFEGAGLVNSFRDGDGTTGTLTSPPFTIRRPRRRRRARPRAWQRRRVAAHGRGARRLRGRHVGPRAGRPPAPSPTGARRPAAFPTSSRCPVSRARVWRTRSTRATAERARSPSPEFEITRDRVNFLVGGGPHKDTAVTLVVDGTVVRRTSGRESEALNWVSWDVSRRSRVTGGGSRSSIRARAAGATSWSTTSCSQIGAPRRARPRPR